jgi:hypothetical protein
LARQRFERGSADETQRGFSRDDSNGVTGLGQLPNYRARLVRGDPAGDADDDLLALGHRRASPVWLMPA